MPEWQWSDQVNLKNSQKTTELLPQKHKKMTAFPPTATFGQLFPFQTSFEAKLFSSPETVVIWLTRQQKAKTEMRTKATGLCELKMLENVLKPKETATVHARKHFSWALGRNWIKEGQKKAICCLKVPFFWSLPGVSGLKNEKLLWKQEASCR